MNPVPYGPVARFSDWWHGWRDGLRGIPHREPDARMTTPHRDVLIRRARDAFEHERLRFEATRARSMKIVAGAVVRLQGAEQRLQAAESELAALPERPDDDELLRRRFGEENRAATVVAQRRTSEHARRRRPLVRAVDAIAAERDACAAELAAAQNVADREREVAAARVRRVHEHSHQRLAAYRRRLIRSHPEGPLIDLRLDVPHMPVWTQRQPAASPPPPDPPPSPARRDGRTVPIGDVTIIGSAPEPKVDIHLDGARVAERHATLRRVDDGYLLLDHGRGGGTFVAGVPVGQITLSGGDSFVIGNDELRLVDGGMVEIRPLRPPSLVVSDLCAYTRQKPRLDLMSFSQPEATVLAILGPSGAGKSSLFRALLGELATAKGSLYLDGLDIRTNGAQIRSMLGFVPQDDSLHRSLTIHTLLIYSDRLRSPFRRHDRQRRVEKVCDDLDIKPELRGRRIDELSGGQRKRVSVALEILADPRLLMLDEPTSGLDAGMDNEVMDILRRMAQGDGQADQGRTIVVVTHSSDNLYLADKVLLLAPGGRPVYLGGHDQLLGTFSKVHAGPGDPNYAELMKALIHDPGLTGTWVDDYRDGPEAVRARDDAKRAAEARPSNGVAARRPRGLISSTIRQLGVLFQRQWALLLSRAPVTDAETGWGMLKGALVVAMPLLIGALGAGVAYAVTEPDALSNGPAAAPTALNLLVTLCMLAGQSLTYSDIVSEFDVIEREHRTGASTVAVVLAKWIVFMILAMAQAGVITLIYVWARGAPPRSLVLAPTAELFVNLAMLSVATMSCGLLISVVAKKLEQAVVISTGTAIAQVAFNGWTADLSSSPVLHAVSALLPARWGFAATASSIDLRTIVPNAAPDALWEHAAGQWWTNVGWMAMLSVVYLLGSILVLRRRLAPSV